MSRKNVGISILTVILVLCELASLTVLFSRMTPFYAADFENVMPLYEAEHKNGISYVPGISFSGTDVSAPSAPSAGNVTDDSINAVPPTQDTAAPDNNGETPSDIAAAPGNGTTDTTNSETFASGAKPEFRMVAKAEIFKFTYDETGKITVISNNGGADKLIAPGTSNLYQFTLENPGNVPLDYHMTMEAYITGTDLWIPVNARVWDYKNKYLVGSADEMVDVLELNTVDESAELGAGRYATYTLEWEWPFERGDNGDEINENDIYDTMLGNLAVGEDLVLTIVIRTVAEYDEDPEDPSAGKPPKTGDDFQIGLIAAICIVSFGGLCIILFAGGKRKEKKRESSDDVNKKE